MTHTPTSFVTGATGFLGPVLCRELLAHGHRVVALTRAGADTSLLPPEVERRAADLFDPAGLARAMQGCGTVFHLAAWTRSSSRDAEGIYRVNVEGTALACRAALDAGAGHFVFVSSVAGVGRGGVTPDAVDETAAFDAHTAPLPYHLSKYLAEAKVRRSAAAGLAATIVNPAMIFGPGDHRRKRLKLFRAAGLTPAPPGGITVCDVRDVAAGVRLAYDRLVTHSGEPPRRFILGGEMLSFHTALARVALAMGRDGTGRWQKLMADVEIPPKVFRGVLAGAGILSTLTGKNIPGGGDFRFHAGRYNYFSSARAERELGYRSRSFDETCADTVSYYRKQGWL